MRCSSRLRSTFAPLSLFSRALALAVTLTLTVAGHAQSASTGTITGRVMNVSNGAYLPKAQIRVAGTTLSTLTNDFGEYTLRNVPAGKAVVRAEFTGLESQAATVEVAAGLTVTQNLSLGSASDLAQVAGESSSSVRLDPFKVEAERYKTAADLAINEERRSVNIKNVVSADQFGDIPGGNIGEFVKYLPGVELEYGGTYIAPTDAFGVSVRGFGSADTAIYVDGVPIASASQASLTTQVGLDMMSINNASRVELIKVPTPDMKMSSVGGQINLISRSAFEYAKPQFTWKAYTVINSEHANPFEKIAGPKAKKTYAGQPGFELSYVHPINEKLGVTVSASAFSQYSANRRFRPEWGTSSVTNIDMRPFGGTTGTTLTNSLGAVSLANPYLTRISVTDSPRTNRSLSASVKGDWRPLPGLTVTGTYQVSQYTAADAARRLQFRTQRPQTWDANSTISLPYLTAAQSANATIFNPSNTLDMNIDSRDKEGVTHTGSFRLTYQKGPWDIKGLASASTSRASFKDLENGHFSTVDVSSSIGQIKFENIVDGVPGKITVFDRAVSGTSQAFDWSKLSNWSVPTIQARSGNAESLDDVFNYKLDVRRELDFLPFTWAQFAVQAGGLREETLKKKWGLGTGWRQTYTGPTLAASDYYDNTYEGYSPGWGLPAQQWISTYRLYQIYQANPTYFNANSDSDQVNNWNSLVGQNKKIKEVTNSWYAMLEGKALDNRLNVVAGLRQESATRTGFGPQVDGKWNYVKEKDGTLYRNVALLGGLGTVRIDQATSILFAQTAQGASLRSDLASKGITVPATPILSGTLAAQMLQRKLLQPVRGESKADPTYSINVAYEITKKLVGKVAYSRTFGRIPLEDGTVGILTGGTSFNINENETPPASPSPSTPNGTISVANPNLLPEISDNWDFNLTYYTDRGGKIGVGYFQKNVKNFSETVTVYSDSPEFAELMGSLGLDPVEYTGWNIASSQNGIGVGKVSGWELELFQDFRFIPALGEWGRRINVFGTYSKTKREETNTTRISARPAASKLATAGINFSMNRLSFNLKGTYRDLVYTGGVGNFTINGVTVQLGQYTPSQIKWDMNVNYQLSKRYSVYASARDVFAVGSRSKRFDMAGIYPAYAQWDDLREFGSQITVGIKGQF